MSNSTPLANGGPIACLNINRRKPLRQAFRLAGLLLLVISMATKSYALKYSATISSNNTNAASGAICPGATRVGLYSFSIVIASGTGGSNPVPILSSITYTTTGTYTSSDVTTGYKLYYSTSPTGLATATQVGSTLSVAGPGTRTFSSLATTLGVGTYYFWITTDISSSLSAAHTITNTSTLPSANVVFSTTLSNGISGTSAAGNTQTLTPQPAAITGTAIACVGATTTLANSISGGTWSSANTSIATVGSTTGTVTGAGTGTTTITYSNGCGTAATKGVTINSLPTTFSVTGGGGYCTGGSGVSVGLGGSQSGVNYQLYNGSSSTGSPVSGTGSSLSFGSQTGAGSYTVRATDATTSCVSGMTGSATVTTNSLPTTFSVTGGGNYCSGGSGVSVGLGGSQSGVNYQLYVGSSTTGSPVAGTGSSISFGSQTAAGSYTVLATNASTSCASDMTGSASVSINTLPTTFSVTGGGNFCSGGSGVSVGLGGSESGVNYQLYNGSTAAGSLVAGTGSSLDFGVQTSSGTYTVRATNSSTSCATGMTGSASVTVDALPTTFSVTGGGNFCSGGSGVSVGLGGSQSGVDYQLYNGSSTAGSPVSGTGSSISFGAQTSSGTYTVRATNSSTSCVSGMTGSVSISIDPLPNIFAVTGGGNYCSGGSGVSIGLGSSQSGINYQLYNGSSTTGSPVAGTGSPISFGAQTAAGTYTVRATSSASCVSNMTGSASVSIDPLPESFTVTGGGNYCTGGSGVSVGLDGSQSGVDYQLYSGSSTTGSPVSGTGSSLDFGMQTAAGTYTVRATNVSTSCVSGMTGTASVSIDPLPTTFTVTGGGNYCSGGSGVSVGLDGSQSGVNYQLYNGSSATGSAVSGTGSAITFGAQTAAGTYTVRATNSSTSCASAMTSFASVSIDPLPTTFTVTGGGNYCTGGSGVSVGLDGSQSGVDYQLYNGSSTTGSSVSGSGSAITFGAQTSAGTYTVRATNSSTSCVSGMTNSASVSIDPLPTTFTVTGGGNYCTGGSGVSVGLDGSQSGVDYQLYNGSSSTGSPVSGTGSTIIFGAQTAAGTYTVRATNTSTSCTSGMTSAVSISIDPLPTTFTVTGGGSYCSGGSGVSVGLNGSQSGVNYQLYNGSSTTGSAVSGTGSTITFGVQTGAGTYTVHATDATTGCASGMSNSAVITIDGLPATHTVTGGGNYCAGGTGVSVGIDGSQTGVDYQLYNGSSTAGTPVTGTGSALSFGTQSATGTYTVRATNSSTGCVNNMTGSASVNIDPLPTTFTLTGGGNYCSGGSGVSVGLDGSQSGVNYQLYNGSSTTGSPVAGTGSTISFGSQTAAGTYTVRATNSSTSCVSGMTGSASISIDPLPTSYTVTGGGVYCPGGSLVDIGLNGSQSGVDYQLYNGASTVGSAVPGTGAAIAFSPQSSAGTYTVVANNTTTGCTNNMSGSTVISTGTLPSAGIITGTATVCEGNETTLGNATTGGDWTSEDETIATVDATGIVSGVLAGTVAISYTVTNACGSATATRVVTVNPGPNAGTISGTPTVCVGSTTSLGTTVSGGAWTSSTPSVASIGSTGVVTGSSIGNSTISYTVSGSCGSATATIVVTVNDLSSAGSISGASTVCVSASTTLTDAVSGGAWTSSDPAVASVSSGVVSGVSAGTTDISYTVSNSCGSSVATHTVTVNPIAGSAGTISGTSTLCTGANTTLSTTGSGGNWSSSDASIATVSGGIVNGVSAGTATISYTVTGCGAGTATNVVTVSSTPSAGVITGSSSVTIGGTVTLSDAVSSGTWSASNSNATVSSTGVVNGVAEGSVVISYTVTTSCGTATSTKSINVISAIGGTTGTLSICVAGTTTLSNSTPGGTWSSNNTSVATVSASGIVTGVAAGMATISYITSGGTTTSVVTVNPTPTPITGTLAICQGAITTLNNTAPGFGIWSSSNAAIADVGSSTGYVTGLSGGTATIAYTLSTGCQGSTVVTVNSLPTAITGAGSMCPGATLTLASSTPGGSWTSDDATVATVNSSGVATGVANGLANIVYTLSTGCKTTAMVTVYALPSPISAPGAICEGTTTILSSTTPGGTWSSSNTAVVTIGTSGAANGLAMGTSTISYTTGSGCSRSIVITVNPAPAISGAAAVCPGVTSTLTGSITGGTWTGGNASIATINSAGVVSGIATGTTNFTYTISTGCKDYATVTVNTTPATITGTMKACTGSSTTLGDATSGGSWSSSDIAVATVGSASGIVNGLTNGITTITYTTGLGCYKTGTVTINPTPSAITGGGTPICVGSSFTLSDATPGLSWSSSNTAVASIASNGVVTGTGAGIATITYTAASTNCISTTGVTINAVPAAITGSSTGCVGSTVTLSNTVPGGTWSSSNTAVAIIGSSSGIVTGVTSGMATLTYSGGAGCFQTKSITINNSPTVTGYATACTGLTTTLSGGTSGTWSSGSPSVATITTSGGYVTGMSPGTSVMTFTSSAFSCPGTYTVTVIPIPGVITGATTACNGSVVTLSNATAGGSWSSNNTAIATVGSATGIVTAVGSGGTAIISYSFGNNCRVTSSFSPKAMPALIGGTPSVCMPVVTTLTDMTSGGTWSSSNTTVATVGSAGSVGNGVVAGVSAGTSEITYTVTNTGCARSVVVTVTAGPDPGTLTSSTGAYSLRTVSSPTSLTLTSSGAPGGTWSSSNTGVASVSVTGVVSAVSSGNTTITYTVTGACTNRITRYITVSSGKAAGASAALADLTLYPNPTTGSFTLTTAEAGTMIIYAMDGREVYQFDVASGTALYTLKQGISSGVYICRFASIHGSTANVRLVYEP